MTRLCPGGCLRQVPADRLACRWCWLRLPAELRVDVRNPAAGGTVKAAVRYLKAAGAPRLAREWSRSA